MKTKEQPSKKVLDISKPKPRRTAAAVPSAPPLIIPKRSVIVQTPEEPETPSIEPLKARQVTVSVQPPSGQATQAESKPEAMPEPTPTETGVKPVLKPTPKVEPAPVEPKPEPEAELKPEPEPVNPAPSNKTIQPLTPPAQEALETPPAKAAEPSETPADANAPVSPGVTTSASTDTKPDKSNASVRKALEDAKREEEIEGYIESHEFFVPINAVARKRSLRRSVALIFLEVILGLFLLNLMLDAGLIELLQKVPHTNFFNLQ